MRPRVLRAIVLGWLICLTLAVLPFQGSTRLVGLGGVILFTAMYLGERRRPRPPTGARPTAGQLRGESSLPFLVHGSPRG